jgi:hypothetical protein
MALTPLGVRTRVQAPFQGIEPDVVCPQQFIISRSATPRNLRRHGTSENSYFPRTAKIRVGPPDPVSILIGATVT